MHRLVALLFVLVLCAPLVAKAHATPVSYEPASSASLVEAPQEISVLFSERLEEGASALKVEGSQGVVSQGSARVGVSDARRLSVFLGTVPNGTYKVTWSVVSADDGHFTRGSYFFAIGESVASSSSANEFELVTKTVVTEALGMTAELMGNGLLWAMLLLFAVALRPLLKQFSTERPLVERFYKRVVYVAAALMLMGGLLQLGIKASDLAGLQETGVWDALRLYIATAAGSATLWRMGAVAAFAAVFFFSHKKIFQSERFTVYEGGLMVLLGVFAYFRAIISHATANQFHPELSIAVNFFHVIEKDFWAGMAGLLLCIGLVPRLRSLLKALIPKAFVMMALSAALVALSACYIVWLHLKSFENLFTTTWGSVCLQLLAMAALLLAARTYHVLARLYRPNFFARYFSATIAAEFIFGVLVVYCSSVVILTSPPLGQPPTKVFSAISEGVVIRLERSPVEDTKLLLTAFGGEPTVTLSGTTLELQKRFSGGYALPLLVIPNVRQELLVVVPQTDRYDARASFSVSASDFVAPEGWEASRPLNMFTLWWLGIALAALACALILAWFSVQRVSFELMPENNGWRILLGLAGAALAGSLLVWLLPASGVSNPFKALCESDGNMWHLMLPTKAGVPTSNTPREGCMWGMGNYTYLFADKAEYEHVRALPPATASLATSPKQLLVGVPATLQVSLAETSGEPAELFVDMEKYVHLVIVSRDQSVFAHIHAKQTSEEIRTSTFSFDYTFPRAGEYLVSADYAHGLTLESKQFKVTVDGAPAQNTKIAEYQSEGMFGGYSVALKYALPVVGEVALLRYTITKDAKEVTDLEQYLSAAMHISVVKNDFSEFMHLHGEVHPQGVPLPPVTVKDGKVVHTMAQMIAIPPRFGPNVEAHVIFPSAGLYTVWGEFKVEGKVIPAAFTVRVEE